MSQERLTGEAPDDAGKSDGAGHVQRRIDALVAVGLALGSLLLLALTAADIGLTYDEPVYMGKAHMVRQWLRLLSVSPGAALGRKAVDLYWHAKDMHPSLLKLLAALCTPVAERVLPPWAVPLTAPRTATMVLVSLCLAVMYLTLRGAGIGREASVFGPLSLLFMPRVFGHSHLLALDAPATAMCFIAVAAGWWAVQRRDWLSIAGAAMIYGLAISTKLNGFFVPLVVLPYALLVDRRRAVWLAGGYLVGGHIVFLMLWPWLWYETWQRLVEYLQFHWKHWKIAVMYFGHITTCAPWHYPIVMSAVTTPVVTLLLAVAGVGEWGRIVRKALVEGAQKLSKEQRLWLLAGWGLVVNLAPNMLPSSPKYGGVRLFLPAMAWIAVIAALVLSRAIQVICRRLRAEGEARRLVPGIILVAALLPSVTQVAHVHPYYLSFYNVLIGGLPGAARRGFEPTYWGDTYLAAVLWLNEKAPADATVWIDPPGMESVVKMYHYMGMMRPDLRTTAGPEGIDTADFAVSQNKPTEFSEQVKALVRSRVPVWTERLDGVPLVFVWRLSANAP